MNEPSCPYCGRKASEIPDVVFAAEQEEINPGAFAREDGTYNRETNHFACNECYVKMGAPSSPSGWKAK
jgi:hypothetical protein